MSLQSTARLTMLGVLRLMLPALALLSIFAAPAIASANGGPVRVVLAYLDGVSNTGPRDASGVLDFVRSEGEVRLSVRGLTQQPDVRYVLWIAREGKAGSFEEFFPLGELTWAADGTAVVDRVVPSPIPDSGWNFALITAEETANPDQPSDRRSIAGRYPQSQPQGAVPRGLPNTGFGPGPAGVAPLVSAIAAVTAGAGIFLLRRRS